jgi:sarcosine oxidase subunit delta
MLLIRCPFCRMERPELEFRHAGAAHRVRPDDPAAVSDRDWGEFLHDRDNIRGITAERWHHVHGCGRFFNALRDTVSDIFIATYEPGAPRPDVPGAGR